MIKNLTIVIPAYNEEKRILPTLRRIREYAAVSKIAIAIIVVDDGSTDRTCDVVEQTHYSNLRLIRQKKNQGKFAAFSAGVHAATCEWVLLYDADGATPITVLDSIMAHTSDYDCLIGSRRVKNAKITVSQSIVRTIFGRVAYVFIRWLAGLPYKDTQCGFKLIKTSFARTAAAQMTVGRFGGDIELLQLIKMQGARMREVPVEWHDVPNSTVRWSDYLKTFADLLKIRRNIRKGIYKVY